MDIYLCYNNEPYNKISKAISTSGLMLQGTLRDETSIVDPEVLIEYNGVLTDYNYAQIADFRRFYFIRNIESVRQNLWRVSMHCDVLKTFSEGILGSPVIVERSSSKFNMMLNDPYYRVQQNPIVMTKVFPNGFDTSHASYVLALVGESVPVS